MKKLISILIATILVFSVASTFVSAEVSPEGNKTYKVTIDYGVEDKKPSFSYVTEGDTIALTSNTKSEEGKFKFVRWTIVGEYEIISGSLTSENLVIRPLGDISIVQVLEEYYEEDNLPDDEKEDEEDEEDKKPSKKPQGDKNDSETSPPTNDNMLLILSGIFFISLLATAVSRKLAK